MTRFLTSELAAISGRLREEPEDFVVVERLLYEPSGEGTHTWFEIEKRDLTTFEAIRRLAKALDRREADFGHAGLKDRRAVTRQTLSLEFVEEGTIEALDIRGIGVKHITRHGNKLKVGHLRGNAFEIRVRGVGEGDAERARAKLALLAQRGVPNRFGAQRFGRNAVTPRLGHALLAGDAEGFLRAFAASCAADDFDNDAQAAAPSDASPADLLAGPAGRDPLVRRGLQAWVQRGKAEAGLRALPKRFLSLCVSAIQSQVFNHVLEERLDTIDEVETGDIAMLHRNGACFLVEDAGVEQPRCGAFEISPTGPLPGPSCLEAQGAQAEREQRALAATGLENASFAVRAPWSQKGHRRALRVPLIDAVTREESGDEAALVLGFELPKGSYATAVLAELLEDPALVASEGP